VRQEPPDTDGEERRKEQLLEGVRLTVHLLTCRLESSSTPELPQELPPWWSTALDEVAKTVIGPGEEQAKLPESKQPYSLGKVLGRMLSFSCRFREGVSVQRSPSRRCGRDPSRWWAWHKSPSRAVGGSGTPWSRSASYTPNTGKAANPPRPSRSSKALDSPRCTIGGVA